MHRASYHLTAVRGLAPPSHPDLEQPPPNVFGIAASRGLVQSSEEAVSCDIEPSKDQEPSPQVVTERIGFFVSDSEWERIKVNNEGEGEFDYIVIGTGFCAMAFVNEIHKRQGNARILCLERGGNILPTHLQNLGTTYTALAGDHAETFHWSLSRKTHDAGYRCRGLFPFFGGRSTIWSACSPQPTDGRHGTRDELRDFPKFMRDTQAEEGFWDCARDLIRVIGANKINNKIYGKLQEELDARLSKNLSQISGAYQSGPTPMAVRSPPSATREFQIYSVPNDLVSLASSQIRPQTCWKCSEISSQACPPEAPPQQCPHLPKIRPLVSIRLNCPVDQLLHKDSDCGSQVVDRVSVRGDKLGGLRVFNPKTKIILATSPIPIATLLLNSFPKMEATVGRRLLGHFLTVLVARIPKRLFKDIDSFQFGANYIAGEDKETKLKYHIQVGAAHSPNPKKDADDALRESPDYTTSPNFTHLQGSEDYVLFSFASHAEMTENNPNNWIRRNNGLDRTSNITLQYLLTEDDEKFWNNMDVDTYKAMEVIAGEENIGEIEYWHQPRTDPAPPGEWKKCKPPQDYIRVPLFFHEASTAYASENPGKDGGSVNSDYSPVWYEGDKAIAVSNVYVTGAALFPTIGSWNPTLTMCAYTQALARKLEPEMTIKDEGSELTFSLPPLSAYSACRRHELLDMAGHRLAFEILPPSGKTRRFGQNRDEAILVLWGDVTVGKTTFRPFRVEPATKAPAKLPSGEGAEYIKAGVNGALYLRYWSTISQCDRDKWKGVEQIPFTSLLELPGGRRWAPSWKKYVHKPPKGCPDDGTQIDLWNLSGIAFNWSEGGSRIGHSQFWACKPDVNCGIHNHEEEKFMEIHMGLSPGTGDGVSRRVREDVVVDRCNPNAVDKPENLDRRIHLDIYEEQGGFWRRNEDGSAKRRPNGSVDYPYHGWRGGTAKDGLDIWCSVEYNPDMKYP